MEVIEFERKTPTFYVSFFSASPVTSKTISVIRGEASIVYVVEDCFKYSRRSPTMVRDCPWSVTRAKFSVDGSSSTAYSFFCNFYIL